MSIRFSSFRAVAPVAVAVASFGLLSSANAALVVGYDANLTTPAQEPSSQGFALGGTNNVDLVNFKGPGSELGTNYYGYVDNNPGSSAGAARNSSIFYSTALTPAQVTDAAGWTARAKLRVVSANNSVNGTIVEIRTGTRYVGISFVNDGTNEFIGYTNSAGTGITSLANFELDAAYVTVDAAYDPVSGNVSVTANGTSIGSFPIASTPTTGISRFGFGSNNSPATGEVHFAAAEFHVGAIPEPVGVATLAGLAGIAVMRRRSAK